MRFIFPQDGDCINKNDGTLTADGIIIEARVSAPADADIFIGGEKAQFSDGVWTAKVLISDYKSILEAENRASGESCSINLLKFADPVGKFRLSSDDNILFCRILQRIRINIPRSSIIPTSRSTKRRTIFTVQRSTSIFFTNISPTKNIFPRIPITSIFR